MKNVFKKIFGFLVSIIFVVIYFYDRAICVFIPLVNHFDIRIWLKNQDEIANSLIRTLVVTISGAVAYGCILFVKWVL